jgi:Glutaminase
LGGFMKYIFLLVCILFYQSAFAEKIISTIYSIDQGEGNEPSLVRFDNGRSSFVMREKSKLLSILNNGFSRGQLLRANINQDNEIISADVSIRRESASFEDFQNDPGEPFRPSVIQSTSEALKIFNKMRRDYTKYGECFNRAHIWAYEAYKKSRLNSMKVFMFFTERYIRKYKYHWWFHVTPAVYVGTTKILKTLDRRYSSGPRQTKTWSDAFIKSKRRCKLVTKFDDYWLNQDKEDCYHINSSMYYVIPRDLEKRDITGIEKDEFVDKELIRAYKNGFGKQIRININ